MRCKNSRDATIGGMGLSNPFASSSSAPTSQTAAERPISFRLKKEGSAPLRIDFVIRPEDLQWTQTSRTSVQQTLGGAWVDTFGEGIATINLSGHTGWRKDGAGDDWEQRFIDLNEVVFKKYHEHVADKKDPEKVVLEFVDVLDKRAVRVVPGNFILKRNKSRPLLMQYNISLTVVALSSQSVAPTAPPITNILWTILGTVAKVAGIAANIAFLIMRKTAPGSTINKIATLVYKVAALVFSIANTVLVVKAMLT